MTATTYVVHCVPHTRPVSNPARYVDLLKIDVEGCQCHVLRSAKRTLQEHRVKYIMIEVTPMNVCGCDHEASMNELLEYAAHCALQHGACVLCSRLLRLAWRLRVPRVPPTVSDMPHSRLLYRALGRCRRRRLSARRFCLGLSEM